MDTASGICGVLGRRRHRRTCWIVRLAAAAILQAARWACSGQAAWAVGGGRAVQFRPTVKVAPRSAGAGTVATWLATAGPAMADEGGGDVNFFAVFIVLLPLIAYGLYVVADANKEGGQGPPPPRRAPTWTQKNDPRWRKAGLDPVVKEVETNKLNVPRRMRRIAEKEGWG
mmetsp:Transcript_41187/g.87743  ORF Transcript_41187/g.87743 Transcript_41187/m.87743 type:complete len:171 (+) Transcript_41187:99-611(+)